MSIDKDKLKELAADPEQTSESIARALGVNSIHRHVDMLFPRLNELKKRNADKLKSGEVSMNEHH
jgi:hypothetical protein